MTHAEFLAWVEFFEQHPFDDIHRYHRPATAVAASMRSNADAVFDWLTKPLNDIYSNADLQTLAAFGLKPPR